MTTDLDIDDIISMLTFVLSNNYFVYNDATYKQIHGFAKAVRLVLWSAIFTWMKAKY